ncbi:hypothetical protein [Amycolatopsis orientalis]|uniref:hypothetical protein n=1 Tax=Amycolatopsis orientalis TaxID=31958 RepID=UPI00042A5BF1|nr:hypothetical protein [Amycolatopsis orientalis]
MQDWLTRATRLRAEVFVGSPYVHVSPGEWQIDPESLRGIARGNGYLEIPPMFQGCLSFQFAPQHFPPIPAFDGPDRPDAGRERWLLNRLGGDDVWISLKHANLSARRVAEIAATEGLRVAADFADPTDRVLLLSRDPAPPRLPLPVPSGSWRFRYSWLNYLAPATVFALLGISAVIVGAPVEFESPMSTLLLVATFVGAVPAAFVTSLFPRTTRVGWLAWEFNGLPHVQFPVRTFGVSVDLAAKIAWHHGYVLYGHTATQASGPILKFYKRA